MKYALAKDKSECFIDCEAGAYVLIIQLTYFSSRPTGFCVILGFSTTTALRLTIPALCMMNSLPQCCEKLFAEIYKRAIGRTVN